MIILFIIISCFSILTYFYFKKDNIETFDRYIVTDNVYCLPGSGTKSSNIGAYQKISEAQAKDQCNKNSSCKGFTYNKKTNQYILKGVLTGKSGINSSYKCFTKEAFKPPPLLSLGNTTGYKLDDNVYCIPGSGTASSNIGAYQSLSLRDASNKCNSDTNCKGFTYNKGTKKFILKNKITSKSSTNKQYSCYSKNSVPIPKAIVPKDLGTKSGYSITDNTYCTPGSFVKESNLGEYRSVSSEQEALKLCDDNPNCKGFTYNKGTGKIILKSMVTGRSNGVEGYKCYTKIAHKITELPKATNIEGYDLTDNKYCLPGSGTASSNIGEYQNISADQAKDKCNKDQNCVGITYNKATKKYILKNKISGKSNTDKNYACYSKKAIKASVITGYKLNDNSYCAPGSSVTSSNIGEYQFISADEAKKQCDKLGNCVGITFDKLKNRYILKAIITSKTTNERYSCYIKESHSIKKLPKPNNISGYTLNDNVYCIPASSDKSSNIGSYQKITNAAAKKLCDTNPTCKGITYNKATNEYLLKSKLTNYSSKNINYGCYLKNFTNKNIIINQDIKNTIKEEIKKRYNIDIESMRNLGAISRDLLTGADYHRPNKNPTRTGQLDIPSDVVILGDLEVEDKLDVNSNIFNILPNGSVLPWNQTYIPSGWAKCDGTNGTPDLSSRFILGEGHGGGLTNRPRGQRGGSETHKLTIAQIPAHTHQYISHYGGRAKVNDTADGNEPGDDPHHDKTHNSGSMGGSRPHNNMPPYHVLIYIMKL